MSDANEPATEPLNPYDEVPYGGQPVPLAHPERLAIAALRRGLSPASPERCRVLELGCAEGANVIPIAFHLEGAEVVGVDASAVQIERATELRDRLGLDNLELRRADILDLGEELGTFDYILCHGVYSWVPEPVRDRILALFSGLLRPHGVGYLSYNARPGWAFRSLMRRALTQRVRDVDDHEERIRRVREVIGWMAASPVKDTPWGQLLAAEASAVWAHRDEYLVHEYLSPENRAFHFREVIDAARSHDLAFLAELTRATSDPRLEHAFRETFEHEVEDWVEAEELAETFLFRAFRCSLFVRADAPVGDAHPELADRLRFAGRIEPESTRLSLEPGVHEFFRAAGIRISAEAPVLKAALLEIARWWPRSLSLAEIEERVGAVLQLRRVIPMDTAPDPDHLRALRGDLVGLSEYGVVDLHLTDHPVAREAAARPRVSPLTRLASERGAAATTRDHRVVPFDAFTRHLVRYLDGARGPAELEARMREHAEAGDVKLTLEDGTPLEPAELDEALPKLIEASLKGLAESGLLEPPPAG